MRRDLWVAALVIIPFVVLIGLTCIGRPPEVAPTESEATQKTKTETPSPPPGERAQPDASVPEVVAGHPSLSRALITNAKQCLTDQHHQRTVEVHFTPTREGRFIDVRVTTQDPYLEACLQDVFEEAQWTVSASATESFAPTAFTFTAE